MATTPKTSPGRVDNGQGDKTPATKPGEQPPPTQAKKAAAFRMDYTHKKQRYLKLLVYGGYGVGKTTLAASAVDVPEMRDVIILNAESGDLILDEIESITTVPIKTFSQLARVAEYLRMHCNARDTDDTNFLIKSEANLRGMEESEITTPSLFRTCIIDSLSEVEAYCFNQLLGISDTTKLDEEVNSAEWSEYKKNNHMMLRVVRAFRDLPMHVVFTSGEKYNQDETKKMKYVPDLTGALAKKIQGFMDMVGYYQLGTNVDGKEVHRLNVKPSSQGRFDAKHRYASFKGSHFDDPTLSSILKDVGLSGA